MQKSILSFFKKQDSKETDKEELNKSKESSKR